MIITEMLNASATFDQEGLLNSLKKALTKCALKAEMDHCLAGYGLTVNTRQAMVGRP